MTTVSSAYLAAVLTTETTTGMKGMLLPGRTTAGHYQIELACSSCHTPFGGVSNGACMTCHGEELTAADDSHPQSKFTDPRNANLVARLDARRCVTCHREHEPEMTRPMGVTLPDDYCQTCHADVGRDRASHAGMTFDTCASAGCHNYHDNTALYEDFLVAHAGEPALRPQGRVPQRTVRESRAGTGAAARLASDAPAGVADASRIGAWETTSHAGAGVNCTGCHTARAGALTGRWLDTPGETECASCHDTEVTGFFGGRHGMRVERELTRMRPELARLPMKAAAHGRELSCVSCHIDHDFDTRRAAVDACLGCHDDGHSRAYRGSSHQSLWNREPESGLPGTGVSCATCHLPRLTQRANGIETVVVQHNQNANLRPNEKMVRTVCLACHGLGFSLDALADPGLVARNFTGTPLRHVAGIDMAMKRINSHSN
jgi:hypothetical protein